MSASAAWSLVSETVRLERLPAGTNLLERSMRADFERYLADDILVKVDRASMLHSLEVRAPMLDLPVIEFAFGKVSPALKASASARKILLKKLCARLLPAEFDRHRKKGLNVPLPAWLRKGEWARYFRDVLLDPGQRIFDRAVVTRLLAGQAKGRQNSERLFGLVMFELWRREYRVDFEIEATAA
jgi:asparagine synthase (glutamine-hydrolysing)